MCVCLFVCFVNYVIKYIIYIGHCGKTIAIIRQFYALSKTTPLKWLVIADDDTLLRYVYC